MAAADPSREVPEDPPSSPPAKRLSARRQLVAALASLALVVLLPLLAWRAMNAEAVRARLRQEVAHALQARLPRAQLVGGARIDWRFRLVAGPLAIPGRDGAAPVVTVQRLVVRPRLAALLEARLEPALVSLEGVHVDAGLRGEALADAWKGTRSGWSARPGRPARTPELRFEDVHLRVALARGPGAAILDLGPLSGRARLERAGPETVVDVALDLAGGAHGTARVRFGGGPGHLSARLDHLGATAIPAPLRSRLPFAVERGDLSLAVEAPALGGGSWGEAHLEVRAVDLALRSEELSPGEVGPITARLTGTLRWDRAAGRLALGPARLDLGAAGNVGAAVTLALSARPEPRFELAIRAEDLDWKAALGALPAQLRLPQEAPPVQGTLAGWLAVSGPIHRPAAWQVGGDVDPSRLEPAPGAGTLALPFTWQAPLPDGRTRPVAIGPANPDFVPLGSLPAYLVRAVLASEDAGFYAHHGFDLHEVQDALSRAGERPRLRGASTITQQLAKNLYLSPERTLVRKAREAMATIALEASVGKRRLLEIYLNLAEWGPGVYGIGQAARHWFGKDARDLSPKEAAFLASVIPNPVRYEMYRRRGALTDLWEERVRDLLLKLRAADALTDDQFREAWSAPLTFARG